MQERERERIKQENSSENEWMHCNAIVLQRRQKERHRLGTFMQSHRCGCEQVYSNKQNEMVKCSADKLSE